MVGALIVILGVAAAVIFPLSTSNQKLMTIKVALFDAEYGGTCADGGTGGYSDIGPGQPVTVKDEGGTIIASTSLPDTGDDAGGAGIGCIWTMKVQVPGDAQQYAVEMGRRGTVTFSHDQLEKNKWEADLSIGG